jgi:tRNA A37 N6-isopentenylltransferase MiaA
MAFEAEIAENTAVHIYQRLWEVCDDILDNGNNPIIVGGAGVIVQIDESQFKHKPKVNKSSNDCYDVHINLSFSITVGGPSK